MKQFFTLLLPSSELSLRTINRSDCENLRNWKNEFRFAFFFQEIISPQMQENWFKQYSERPNDYMFIAQIHGDEFGCMGFRLLNENADIYNVILGNLAYKGSGYMSKAMMLMCSYIYKNSTQEIELKVLKTNPALNWYKKIGFEDKSVHDTYFELRLNKDKFKSFDYQMSF